MIQLRPITSYLTKFDHGGKPPVDIAAAPPPFESMRENFGFLAEEVHDEPSEPPASNELDDAREALRAELEREFQVRLEEERQGFEQEREAFARRLEAERAQWAREEGAKIAEDIHAQFEGCLTNLRAALARLLTPFLTHRALEQSIADFVAAVRAAASDQANPTVELRGSRDLLEVVADKLSEAPISIRTIETDGAEIAAHVDGSLIETCMQEWVRRLRDGE
jgi:hypothetical protein